MLALGAGVAVQRVCQLVAFVLVGNALGVEGLGVFAQGQAMAAVLAVVAGAGSRNLTARQLAYAPSRARALVARVVRLRLLLGAAGAAAVAAVAFPCASAPWFWVLCALQVLPAAFDLKSLLDATGRARAEIALETGVAALQLVLVAVACAGGTPALDLLAAIALGARCVYGAFAAVAIRALRDDGAPVAAPRHARGVAAAQALHELLCLGDVWLVAVALGDAAAGYYACAVRFAAAALVPSAQLARLLLPHLLHAGATGDAARTLATALRATALATLPMLGGGIVLAAPLCSLAGEHFAPAANALRLLLLAGCLQHLGWQCTHALLAERRDRACATGLGVPSALHAAGIAALAVLVGPLAWSPVLAATAAAAIAVAAQGAYLAASVVATRASWRAASTTLAAPAAIAIATGAAVAVAACAPLAELQSLAAQLLAGGGAFALGVWLVELRGRWRRVGDGLAAASGFRS
jgi:O-antigen/teichoic acid export membrane protein